MQPAFEHTAAHGGNRAVENRRQRIFHAASEVLSDLQVAARGGIHDDAVLLTLHGNGTDMGQGGTLRILNVLQQAACGTQSARGVFYAKANQISRAKLQVQLLARGINFELPQWTTTQAAATFNQRRLGEILCIKQFCRIGAL